jgi:hypothetical protein
MNWFQKAIIKNEIILEAGGKGGIVSKELRQFFKRYLKPAGWKVLPKPGKGHQKELHCPCGQHKYTIATSPSDHRAIQNLKSDLRRMCPQSGL